MNHSDWRHIHDVLSISNHRRTRYFWEIVQPSHITGHVTGCSRISYEDSFFSILYLHSFILYANSFGFCSDPSAILVPSHFLFTADS